MKKRLSTEFGAAAHGASGRRIGSADELAFARLRAEMVEYQLHARGVRQQRLLHAMSELPRHEFVPRSSRSLAYDDIAIPIGHGQTLPSPYMVATVVEALQLGGRERVLEVGTGSGYQAALLALLANEVISVEIVPELAHVAESNLKRTGYSDVRVVVGDGSLGWPEHAAYDAIVVGAGSPRVPAPMLEQLAEGGRLLIPVGERNDQQLLRVRKERAGLSTERLVWCEFVPLVGRAGWQVPAPDLH